MREIVGLKKCALSTTEMRENSARVKTVVCPKLALCCDAKTTIKKNALARSCKWRRAQKYLVNISFIKRNLKLWLAVQVKQNALVRPKAQMICPKIKLIFSGTYGKAQTLLYLKSVNQIKSVGARNQKN